MSKDDSSWLEGTGFGLVIGFFLAFALFKSGVWDNSETWTASDMRGEFQLRIDRLDEREAKASSEWELLKIQGERTELLAIMEPYPND